MNTIKTFIPSDLVETFEKFASKAKKNVEDFSYEISKPYEKLFYHPVIQENGMAGHRTKAFHEVCDLTINMPDESDWRLVATFKDGAFTPCKSNNRDSLQES